MIYSTISFQRGVRRAGQSLVKDSEVFKINIPQNEDVTRKVGICTLGCKVNQYESQAIAEEFERNGFTVGRFSEKCGIYVINTCAVTVEAERKARQMIRRAARHNPKAFVLVTGCYAQLCTAKTAAIDRVDFVCGNSNKLKVVDAALGLLASGAKNGAADVKVEPIRNAPLEHMSITRSERTRAYVKIEDGCDNHCAYCTVPMARGPVRSRPIQEITDEVKTLAANGYSEVILTGIDTSSYGKEITPDLRLPELVNAVSGIDGIERVRLGSLDPSTLNKSFVDRISTAVHLCPSFHIALQSGSSSVLARMRRKYNAATVSANLAYIREKIPGVTFSADVIVGFPGETEEEFNETVEFVKKEKFLHLHVFPYSKRPGTPAAEMEDQISEEVKAERVAELEKVGAAIVYDMAGDYIGRQTEVLFESCDSGKAVGHTPEFLEVSVITHDDLHGAVRTVKLNGFDGKDFTGFIV